MRSVKFLVLKYILSALKFCLSNLDPLPFFPFNICWGNILIFYSAMVEVSGYMVCRLVKHIQVWVL